jgi:hypothetical protein
MALGQNKQVPRVFMLKLLAVGQVGVVVVEELLVHPDQVGQVGVVVPLCTKSFLLHH